ncbi:MAG: alkaline phosphatase [Halieaceae bacterium]|jgi:alkaline phosphatase|nr:alkaline phosphatase [Halieaceae bacterium]
MTHIRRLSLSLLLGTLAPFAVADDSPANVILIIGDGFDDQHVTMGRNYLEGAGGTLLLDQMPMRGALHIETVDDDLKPVYVADSANTATTIATGVITQIGRIGTDPQDRDIETIAEAAIKSGMRAGVVSTSAVTDATPASFVAHVSHRSCQNAKSVLGSNYYGTQMAGCPDDAAPNGGPGSISEQMATSKMSVILGGGAKHFKQRFKGEKAIDVASVAEQSGFRVLRERAELATVKPGERLLGLFADGHLPVRLQGQGGRRAESVTVTNEGDTSNIRHPEPMHCEPNPDYRDTPPLAELTEVALKQLSTDNRNGFFLMVESASIDKQSHGRNPCGSIGEIQQLEESLAVALEFAQDHPNTLVVVTADHAQAAQIIPEPSRYAGTTAPAYSPGKVARIINPDDTLMAINYATTVRSSANHTGANVPLFANEVGLKTLTPFLRQRDLHAAMMQHLGLKP